MPDVIELDFTGAPPSEGPSFSDHIPPGLYDLRVSKAERVTASNGKPMISVAFRVVGGQETGKKLADLFVLPRTEEESKVGLQRLHMLLVAVGSREIPGKARIDLATLANRVLRADVEDSVIPAKDNYPERLSSRPAKYLRRGTLATAAPQATQAPLPIAPAPQVPTPAPAPAPAPASAPVAPAAQSETLPWEEEPAPTAPTPTEPASQIASKIADDLDALFG